MDAQTWRVEQRRLREAVRRGGAQVVQGVDEPAAVDLLAEVVPPDIVAAPIHSERGPEGSVIVAVKRLLRRLLAPLFLEPQSRFNAALAEQVAGQGAVLNALVKAVEERSDVDRPREHAAIDYAGFEDRFRGTDQAIAARQEEYASYFQPGSEVLDVGCGRGEFLNILAARGISARGVDIDEEMVARCRARGLTAYCADAREYLEHQPDELFGGVFMSQVVEHLTTEELVSLLDAIARKTRPDGLLIAETINPESLPVLARWFWLDPTHVRLVHPETLQFFMDSAGYEIKTVQFRQPVSPDEMLPELHGRGAVELDVAEYNAAVERLNQRLFGPLDYFVVGQRRS